MAPIESLELAVNVDISSALTKLEDLQEELQDLAETIESIDARGSDGISISTTLRYEDEFTQLRTRIEEFEDTTRIDLRTNTPTVRVRGTHARSVEIRTTVSNIEEELATLEATIRGFEMAHDISIPVKFERSNVDRVTSTMRNLQNTSITQTVDFTPDTEAIEKAKSSVEDVGADLGLEELGDGELTVKNMKVAAARVTVIGDGADESTAASIMDVLDGFNIDTGDGSNIDLDRRDAPSSGADPTWLFGPRGGQRGSRNWFRDVFADPQDLQLGMADIFGGPTPTDESNIRAGSSSAERLLNAIEETQDLGDAMQSVRKTTNNLGDELDGFQKQVGDERSRMMQMEAARAPNTPELFDMLERDNDSIIGGRGDGSRDRDSSAFAKLRRSMRKLTSQTHNARKSLSKFDLRMSDMHNLMATLIPLLFVFIGTIPAVVTALAGLAAAAVAAAAGLAALAGFGAMGVAMEGGQFNMDNLTEVWNDIRDAFIEAFAPLADRLEPLFMDAIDGLEKFFQAIANEGGALMELTDEARAFGSFLMDFVPGALRTLAAVAEALAPTLSDIGRAIQNGFRPAMRELVRLTQNAMPAVSDLVQTIIGAIPTIVEISIQFAKVATAALDVIGFVWNLVTVFGLLDEQMGFVLAIGLTLLTFLGLLIKVLGPIITLFRILSAQALAKFALALTVATKRAIVLAGTLAGQALMAIYAFSAAIVSSIPVLSSYTIAQYAATAALASFITLATLGTGLALVGMAMSAASGFMSMADGIDSATNSLKNFDRVAGNTEGGFNPYSGGDPPTSGGVAARGGGSAQTVINVESSGDPDEDRSNAKYVSFRQGRTTGGNN